MFTLSSYIGKLLDAENKKTKSDKQMGALIGLEVKLYSLNPSHPNFGVIHMIEQKTNKSRIISVSEIFLYQKNENNLTLLSYIKNTGITIGAERTASLLQTRISKKK